MISFDVSFHMPRMWGFGFASIPGMLFCGPNKSNGPIRKASEGAASRKGGKMHANKGQLVRVFQFLTL